MNDSFSVALSCRFVSPIYFFSPYHEILTDEIVTLFYTLKSLRFFRQHSLALDLIFFLLFGFLSFLDFGFLDFFSFLIIFSLRPFFNEFEISNLIFTGQQLHFLNGQHLIFQWTTSVTIVRTSTFFWEKTWATPRFFVKKLFCSSKFRVYVKIPICLVLLLEPFLAVLGHFCRFYAKLNPINFKLIIGGNLPNLI